MAALLTAFCMAHAPAPHIEINIQHQRHCIEAVGDGDCANETPALCAFNCK
jgi:hypothetical protein